MKTDKTTLIAIEGIDGSGKNTQSKLLRESLAQKGIESEVLNFPMYDSTFFGREVGAYLNGEFGGLKSVHPKLAAVLYAGDRFEAKSLIEEKAKEFPVVLFDRYVPSNIAHHSVKLPKEERKAFRDWVETMEYEVFKIPRPDLVLFLDMAPHIADKMVEKKEKRSYTDKKKDLHEANAAYLIEVYDAFMSLAEDSGWSVVRCYDDNGPLSTEAIAADILSQVERIL